MFCPNCGNKNDDSSAFCAWCGTPLKNFAPPTPPVQQPAQPVQQPIQQPVQAQEPVYPAPVQPEQAPVYPEPEPAPVQPEAEQPEPVEESNNCEDVRCSNCGTQMPGDERVCPNCGHICISEVDEEEEESSSKGKIIGIILGAIALLGGIAFLGHKMEWWEIPFLSSSSEKSTEDANEELDFDRISGTINAESGISGTFNYDIAWPEGGDADVRNEIRSWIFKTIFDKPYTQGDNLKESLNTAAQEFFANNSDIDGPLKTITVKDESEDTFDGYLNLQASIFTNAEGGSRRSNFFENSKFQLIMRLDDNKIITSNELKGQNAIKDANKIRRLIHKYQNISEYLDENKVPTVDETCLYLSKDGVSIASYNSVFNRGRLETFCIIPYAEAIPALSDEVKSFLPNEMVEAAMADYQKEQEAMAEFKKSLPSFELLYINSVYSDGNHEKLNLEERGFKKKQNTNIVDSECGEMDFGTTEYTLMVDPDHYCLITDVPYLEGSATIFSIVGYPELMEEYKAEAEAFKRSGRYSNYGDNPWLEIRENEIEIGDGH